MRLVSLISKFPIGGTIKKGARIDGVNPNLISFYNELAERFPDVVLTSGYRTGNGIGKAGKKSRHNRGEAIDLRVNPPLRKFLNSKDGISLMYKYGLGFLDESVPKNLNDTRGTAPHYHIGTDPKLVNYTNKMYKQLYGVEEPLSDSLSDTDKVQTDYMDYKNSINRQYKQEDLTPNNYFEEPTSYEDYLEYKKLQEESENQKLVEKKIEQLNERIELELTEKMKQKQNLLAMLPQAQSIN